MTFAAAALRYLDTGTAYQWSWGQLPERGDTPIASLQSSDIGDALLMGQGPWLRIEMTVPTRLQPLCIFDGDVADILREFALECAMNTLDVWQPAPVVEDYLLSRDPAQRSHAAAAASPQGLWYLNAMAPDEYAQLITAAAIGGSSFEAATLALLFMPHLYGRAAGGRQAARRLRRTLASKLLYRAAAQ